MWGPQPYEDLLSEICLAFNCPPDVAERQDWRTVQRIFDARNAKVAFELAARGSDGFGELRKHKHLQVLLLEMHRAQLDERLTMDDVWILMEPDGDEDEEAD